MTDLTLEESLEKLGGCGDGNCKVYVRPGMHTNGGCKCLRHDPLLAERVLYLHKKEIKRLRAENESLRQSFPVVPGPVAQADLDWALRGEIEELKAENRQWAAYCGKLRDKLCEEYQADFDQMVGEGDEND